jgi:hypothetical protein
MPRAKPPQLTPEEQGRRDRAIAKQKAAKDEEKQILAAARKRATKADNRISTLIGIATRAEVEKNPARKAELIALLTRFFMRENERQALEAYGVPPLSPRPAPVEPTPADAPSAEIAAGAVQGFGDGLRMVRH